MTCLRWGSPILVSPVVSASSPLRRPIRRLWSSWGCSRSQSPPTEAASRRSRRPPLSRRLPHRAARGVDDGAALQVATSPPQPMWAPLPRPGREQPPGRGLEHVRRAGDGRRPTRRRPGKARQRRSAREGPSPGRAPRDRSRGPMPQTRPSHRQGGRRFRAEAPAALGPARAPKPTRRQMGSQPQMPVRARLKEKKGSGSASGRGADRHAAPADARAPGLDRVALRPVNLRRHGGRWRVCSVSLRL